MTFSGQTPARPQGHPANDRWILLGLFLGALAVRIVGIDYGYFHGDERINHAVRVLAGEIVPGEHYYPPLFNYINAVFIAVMYAIGRLIPVWHDTGELRALYFENPLIFYLSARFVTSLTAAVSAPIFYLCGRVLGLTRAACLTLGLLGMLLPVSVLLSHIAKSDVPLATCGVALIYLVLLRQKTETAPLRVDIALGIAVVLGLSFKQSFVFLAAPLLLGHGLILLVNEGLSRTLRSAARGAAVCLLAWPVLNIGIVLDLERYLEYQKIQSVMSLREDSFLDGLSMWWSLFADTTSVPVICAVLFLAFPLALALHDGPGRLKITLLAGWLSVMAATVITILLVGARQQSGLWIMAFTAAQLFAGLSIGLVLAHRVTALRGIAAVLAVGAVGFSAFGSYRTGSEALARPVTDSLAEIVTTEFASDRILTAIDLDVPTDIRAAQFTRDRDIRLAQKYNVILPEVAAENQALKQPADPVYILLKPILLWGLESSSDEDLEGIIQAFAWPPQPEEWSLDYWLDLGFGIYITTDLDHQLSGGSGTYVEGYHRALVDRCAVSSVHDPVKPLFLETRVHIFDCRALLEP